MAGYIRWGEANPTATAVAVKSGKFTAVGTDKHILQMAGDDTRLIELKKKGQFLELMIPIST